MEPWWGKIKNVIIIFNQQICEGFHCSLSHRTRLANLLCRLESDPGTIALMEGADLELIAEMDCEQMLDRFPRFSNAFLANLQVIIILYDTHCPWYTFLATSFYCLSIHYNKQYC